MKNKYLKTFLCAFIIPILLTGCASILSKSVYPVNITSDPENTDIVIQNSESKTIFAGKTPTTVSLDARKGFFQGEDYKVSFSKEGYTQEVHYIQRNIDGWYFGNIIFGGLIGILIVDPATGAMWRLENLEVNLSKVY